MMTFSTLTLTDIDRSAPDALDALPFGVIGLNDTGIVEIYNKTESRYAGLDPENVLGHHLFTGVAPCMNNFMVAERFEEETELDETIDYVLTFRMRPTPVKLRMLKNAGALRRYILVQYKAP
jgi:photoactive yellow protein